MAKHRSLPIPKRAILGFPDSITDGIENGSLSGCETMIVRLPHSSTSSSHHQLKILSLCFSSSIFTNNFKQLRLTPFIRLVGSCPHGTTYATHLSLAEHSQGSVLVSAYAQRIALFGSQHIGIHHRFTTWMNKER
jgi:hypothetical protein